MFAGISICFTWLVFSLHRTLPELIVPRIKIGIIVDKQLVQSQDMRTNIISNVSIEWHIADLREAFNVFRKIILLDEKSPDVDIIVLLGYNQSKVGMATLPETKHKPFLILNRDSHTNSQTALEQWMANISNARLPKRGQYDSPHCKFNMEDLSRNTDQILMMDRWKDSNLTNPSTVIGHTIRTTPMMILVQLVTTKLRTSICVLHDSFTEPDAGMFVNEISKRGPAFVIQNVDKTNDLHATLLQIYRKTVTSARTITYVVICRLNCLMKVLTTANEFDSINTEFPTLLRQFSRWLAVVYGYNSQVTTLLQTVARNLDNFAVVPVPELIPPTVEKIPERLETFLYKLYMYNFSYESDVKSDILNRISKEIYLMEPTSICSHYFIDTLLWTNTGQQFHTVGHADFDGNVELKSELYPNTQYGYMGRQFKVAIEPYPPFVNEIVNDRNETKYAGIYVELLNELAEVLNFTYTIFRPPDGKWGIVERTENGTDIFNGMIGMLQRKEVDFAATPMTIIHVRDKVVDFSYPVTHTYTTLIVKKPDPNTRKWRTLIDPLKVEVLIYIGVALSAVTLFIFLIEKFGPYYTMPKNAANRKREGGLHHIHDSFWYMYGALLCQGGVRLPDSFAGRTLVSAWWIFCIVIVGTYCGNLIAFLTVTKVVVPFNSIDEMTSLKGQYKWGTQGGTVWETLFATSTNPTFQKVAAGMREFNKSDSRIMASSRAVQIQHVLEGGYAWISDETSIKLEMSKQCDLTTIKERVMPMSDAFAFQHNSPHTVVFSKQIMKSQEAGLIEIWKRKWMPSRTFCPDLTILEAKPISLRDVQSAFYVCLIGIFFGTVACLVEIIIFRCRQRRTNTNSAPTEQVSSF